VRKRPLRHGHALPRGFSREQFATQLHIRAERRTAALLAFRGTVRSGVRLTEASGPFAELATQ
jgi:hypothetical protein